MGFPAGYVREKLEEAGATSIRQAGDRQLVSCCPMHSDKSPSFSISTETGAWTCHAGCGSGSLPDLLHHTTGVSMRDAILTVQEESGIDIGYRQEAPGEMRTRESKATPKQSNAPAKKERPAPPPPNPDDIETTYPYHRADGQLEFEVVRLKGKRFRQRRRDGNSWIWNTKGVNRGLLYRLPHVLEAVENGKIVYLTEGEKDADAVQAETEHGVATTTAGGSKAWQRADDVKQFAKALKGANVIAIPDRDEAGRAWAKDVAAALEGVAAKVSFAHAREGKDAFDHLQEWPLKDLEPIADFEIESGTWMEPGPELADIATWLKTYAPAPVWLLDKRIARGDCSLLVGPSGVGKTWVSYDLALSLAAGHAPWGYNVSAGQFRVLVIDEENPGDEAWRRVNMIATARGFGTGEIRDHLMITQPSQGLSFRSKKGKNLIRRLVNTHKPDLVIIDSVTAVGDFDDDNSAVEVRRFFRDNLFDLRRDVGCCVLGIHHTNKGLEWGNAKGESRPTDMSAYVRGSGDWKGASDSLLIAVKEEGQVHVHSNKVRRGKEPEILRLVMTDGDNGGVSPLFVGEGKEDKSMMARAVVLAFVTRQPEPTKKTELVNQIHGSNPNLKKSQLRHALEELIRAGDLETVTGEGMNHRTKFVTYKGAAEETAPTFDTEDPGMFDD